MGKGVQKHTNHRQRRRGSVRNQNVFCTIHGWSELVDGQTAVRKNTVMSGACPMCTNLP